MGKHMEHETETGDLQGHIGFGCRNLLCSFSSWMLPALALSNSWVAKYKLEYIDLRYDAFRLGGFHFVAEAVRPIVAPHVFVSSEHIVLAHKKYQSS